MINMKLILLFTFILCTSAKDVLTVTKDNIDDTLNKNEFVLLKFYAPWCGHCKALAPEYERLAKEGQQDVVYGEIDATVETSLASKYRITGYPVMKWFVNSSEYEYRGGRTFDQMNNWIKLATSEWAQHLYTQSDVELFIDSMKEGEAAVLSSDEEKDVRSVATLVPNVRWGWIKTYELPDWPKGTLKVLYKGYINDTTCYPDPCIKTYEGDETHGKVDKFIRRYSVPFVLNLNHKSGMQRAFSYSKTHLLAFASPEDWDNVYNQLLPIGEFWSPSIATVMVPRNYTNILKMFDVNPENLPVVAMVKLGTKVERYKIQGKDVDTASIRKFVNDVLDGKVKEHFKSEDPPEVTKHTPGKVMKVVGKNFNDTLNIGKDVFVKFYAPWCGHCKKMAPAWETLSNMLINEEIIIAEVDATANEHPNWSVTSYPTLIYYQKGKEPVEYKGEREAEHLVAFIHDLHPILDRPDGLEARKDEL